MIEVGKWYEVDLKLDDPQMFNMVYFVFLEKDGDAWCAAFLEDGELFEFDVYNDFQYDKAIDKPPFKIDEGQLKRRALKICRA